MIEANIQMECFGDKITPPNKNYHSCLEARERDCVMQMEAGAQMESLFFV